MMESVEDRRQEIRKSKTAIREITPIRPKETPVDKPLTDPPTKHLGNNNPE